MAEVQTDQLMKGHLVTVGLQGVAGNQRLTQQTQLAFQRDLFHGGQSEAPAYFVSLSMLANRTANTGE